MDKINRASIISSKPLDFEIPLLQLKEITLKSKTLSPRTKPQTLEKFLQIELKNNQKSIVTYLQNIQTSETIAKTNPRGSICSRYSRNKESVSQLFSLLKPERVKSSIFMKKIETSEGYQTSLKDTLLTNEQLIEIAINILYKPINYRSSHDIRLLVKSTENITFFQAMIKQEDREKHEQCCRYMTIKALKAGEVVFHEGSLGTTFYIILKGSVSLLIPEIPSNKKNGPESPLQSPSKITNTKDISPKSLKKKTNIVKNNMDRETIMKISTYEELGVDKSTKLKEKPQIVEPPKLKKIKTLSSGDSFGELALIENQPRAATIICDTDCYFSVLEKEYFNWILKEKQEKDLFQQIEFLVSMKLFASWSFNAVKKLFLVLDTREFKKNMSVYTENDPPNYMYIIKSGEFKVLKALSYFKNPDTLQKKIQSLEHEAGNYALSNLKNPLLLNKTCEVSILQKAEYFGEEELLIPQKRRNSIICSSSSGALYLLNKDEFTKRIFNDDKTLEVLKLHLSLKKQFFQMQIRKFVTTSLKMQVSMENSKGISMDCKDRNNENFLLKESNLHIELNSDRKIRTRRLNFSKSMIHPEDIVKTLQNSEKMKTLGFESNMSSPKQKFHMLKTFFQSQDKERTINIEKPIPQKPETIPKTPQIRNAHIPKNIELRRKRSEPLNSFITMPINIENVTEFLKNKDFPACKSQNQSMVLKNEWIRSNTAGNIDCRRKTFQNIKEGLEKQEACTVKKEEFDLPLKYRSEDLKSNAKKNLKNYLRYYNPTNTQFLKTVSCFNNLQGLGSFNL